MSGPKHLWSGDWERESAEAAARRARFERAREAALPPPPAPAEPTLSEPRTPPRTPPRSPRTPPRSRRSFAVRVPRTALLIGLAALVLAGGAYALTSLPQSGSPAGGSGTPWLGVQLLGAPGGALVAEVMPGSPAEAAGLRAGDVITRIQGRPVVSPINITEAVEVLSPGQTVQIVFQRGPQTYTAKVTLAARPARYSSP